MSPTQPCEPVTTTTITNIQDEEFITPLRQISTSNADLTKNLRILYVCPSRVSLQGFSAICKSPFLKGWVEHVIFIPRAANTPPDGDDLAQQHAFHPPNITVILREGLASLPKLTTISVQNFIAVPGLNTSTVHFSESLMREYEIKGVLGSKEIENLVSAQKTHINFQTLEPLFGAMVPALNNIETLTLGDGHSSQLHHSQLDFDLDPVSQGFQNLFTNLTKLSISATARPTTNAERTWYNASLALHQLEFLRIFEENTSQHQENYSVTAIFLAYGDMARLRKLQLLSRYKSFNTVEANDMQRFLLHHGRSLEEVELRGVVFEDSFDYEEDWSVIMVNCLLTIRSEMQQLRSFVMHVARPEQEEYRVEIGQLAQTLNICHYASGWDFVEFVMRRGKKRALPRLPRRCPDGWSGPGWLDWESDSTMC